MPARKNPGGGKGQDKIWSDAIRVAAFRSAEKKGPKYIAKAAEKLVELAMNGDVTALKEMGDRLEGKPTQAISGPNGGSIPLGFSIEFVKPED